MLTTPARVHRFENFGKFSSLAGVYGKLAADGQPSISAAGKCKGRKEWQQEQALTVAKAAAFVAAKAYYRLWPRKHVELVNLSSWNNRASHNMSAVVCLCLPVYYVYLVMQAYNHTTFP